MTTLTDQGPTTSRNPPGADLERPGHASRVLPTPAVAAFLFAGVILFARLGDLPLINPDEGRNATIALEMRDSGAWLVPTLNGLPYLDKPALYFRIVAWTLDAFGTSEAAARLPSALSGAALLVLIFGFARRAYGDRTAALAVAVVASTPLVAGFARMVIFDMPLALFTSSAILAGYAADGRSGTARRTRYLLCAGAAAVATLIKGPVGFAVPALVLVAFHLVERRPEAIRRLFGPFNLLVFVTLVLPWVLGVWRHEPDFLYYGIVEETLRRFLTPAFGRGEPIYYFALVLPVFLYPWSVLLPVGLASAWRSRRRLQRADRLLIVWASVVILLFSASQSKRPGYVLTSVVVLGILTARILDRAFADPAGRTARRVLRSTLEAGLIATVAGGVLALDAIVPPGLRQLLRRSSDEFARLESGLPLLGVCLLGLGAVALLAHLRRDLRLAVAGLLLPPLLLLTVGFGAATHYAETSSSRPLARALAALPERTVVACLECFPLGLSFYLGRAITYITEHGRALTSNYIRFRLRKAHRWPEALVHLDERDPWFAAQTDSIYLITLPPARRLLEEIAAARGATPTEFHPGWWGALLPPARTR